MQNITSILEKIYSNNKNPQLLKGEIYKISFEKILFFSQKYNLDVFEPSFYILHYNNSTRIPALTLNNKKYLLRNLFYIKEQNWDRSLLTFVGHGEVNHQSNNNLKMLAETHNLRDSVFLFKNNLIVYSSLYIINFLLDKVS